MKNWGILALSCIGAGVYYRFANSPSHIKSEQVIINDANLGNRNQGDVSVDRNAPKSQKLARAIYVAQIIQICGMLCFGKNRIESLIQLAGIVGTLFGASRMNWIEVSHESLGSLHFNHRLPQNRFSSSSTLEHPTISYHALLPHNSSGDEETCSICLTNTPDSYFCSNKHPFCKDCLVDFCVSKVKNLATKILDGNRFGARFHYSKSEYSTHYTYDRTAYTFHLPENELPRCPICVEFVSHAFLTFKQGAVEIQKEEEVDNAPKSRFWASSYLLFSAIQLTMALVQYTHPHLAGTLYKVQKWMLPLDGLVMCGLVFSENKIFPDKKTALLTALALTAILAGGITLYAYLKKPTSLISHLKDRVSKLQLDQLVINGTPPRIHRLMQGVFGSRLFFALAIATFSSNKKLLIAAALLNGATALKLAHVTWICFQRTFKNEVGLSNYASTATPRFYFMIPNAKMMLPNDLALTDTLSQIYDYTSTLFKDSKWDVYWKVFRNEYGFETGRKLMFDVTVPPSPLSINGMDFIKLLHSWKGTAFSRYDGTGSLNITFK